jgi:Protein of unknown function (DUF2889)
MLEPGVVLGALEDTAHHIRVVLKYGGGRVRSVTGEAVRLPWTTCPGAAAGLATLAGNEVTSSLRQLRRSFDATNHCTHFFDLSQLAISHAASGRKERHYEVVCSPTGTATQAILLRDGEQVLAWTIEGGAITDPPSFAGVGLQQGFLEWCSQNLDEDAAEGAFVLRRAAGMSGVASMRLDDYHDVAASGLPPGVCFTAQSERIQVAFRNVGSQRDYSEGAQGMLEGFAEAVPRDS